MCLIFKIKVKGYGAGSGSAGRTFQIRTIEEIPGSKNRIQNRNTGADTIICNCTTTFNLCLTNYLRRSVAIRDVYPGSEFFSPGSRVKKIPDPHQRIQVF
jgi:hypothetical protein